MPLNDKNSERHAAPGAEVPAEWNHLTQVLLPDVFGEDHAAGFAYRKAQRIVAACYLVTETLTEHDPLRWEVRREAIRLQQSLLEALQRSARTRDGQRICRSRLANLIAMLDVAHTAGSCSRMNYQVIAAECTKLDQALARTHEHDRDDVSHLFAAETVTHPPAGHASSKVHTRESAETEKDIKKTQETHSDAKRKDKQKTESGKSKSQQEDNRKSQILELVQSKGRVNVKDVSRIIVDCSEKTLQRDLAALVQDGVLRKEGERRWSTYVLEG